MEPRVGKIVLKGVALLLADRTPPRSGTTLLNKRMRIEIGRRIREVDVLDLRRYVLRRRRRIRRLVRQQDLVRPLVSAVLPPDVRAPVVDYVGRSRRGRGGSVAAGEVVFDTQLAGRFDPIGISRFDIDLAEIQVLGERVRDRPVLAGDVGRQQRLSFSNCQARIHVWQDAGLVGQALVFPRQEEVGEILDDRPADRRAVLLVGNLGLGRVSRLFRGRLVAQLFVGEYAEAFSVELVRTGLGLRNDDRARRVAIFGAVVRCDHLVLGDGELRERVAGIAVTLVAGATSDTRAAADKILLADTVDEHVYRGRELGASAQGRIAALPVNTELHARDRIRELEEVAGRLWQRGDVVQGDELVHLRAVNVRRRPPAGDDDPALRSCRFDREFLYLLGRDRNDVVGSLGSIGHVIVSGGQAGHDIGPVSTDGCPARGTGGNLGRDSQSARSGLTAYRRGARLG